MRQQRKGSPIGVADEDLDETWLQDESGLLCGLLDHGSEPVEPERGEHEQVRLDDLGEALVIGQVSEAVRADRDHEHAAEDRLRERVEELLDLGRVVRGECLLALIDDEQRLSDREIDIAEGIDRMFAGRHDGDFGAARDELGTDPRSDERRLADPG